MREFTSVAVTRLCLAVAASIVVAAGCRGADERALESAAEEAAQDVMEQASGMEAAAPSVEEMTSQIRATLDRELGGRISGLKVEFRDGVAWLSGVCDSEATRERAMGLVRGLGLVSGMNVDGLTVQAAAAEPTAEPRAEMQRYTVRRGDWLSKIAERYYGDPMKYRVIFEANRDIISDADRIEPGQSLRIPPQ